MTGHELDVIDRSLMKVAGRHQINQIDSYL
ncbi:hypothetical protein DFR47_11534 [Pseudochrobactrum asaccharolyticum]|uniref:Uncharacterized protein n=1 Tax=Pseudochrobactrum asaccharolyticum TaxID=354351 RepID=A0A366DHV3_9HYPH|nr:hypothetical protein DFR47_11534 [Pseudochrobactrum asaccharolyticum]